jgi:hypothetical protein
MRGIFALIPFILLLQAYLNAEEAAPDFEKELRSTLARKVSFDFVDTPLADAIQFFAGLTKQKIILDAKAIEGAKPVSLKADNVVMIDALKQILDKAELEIQAGNDAVYIVKKGTPQSEVLKPLAPVQDWEKEIYKKLQKKITFEFVDTPLSEAIFFISQQASSTIIFHPTILNEPSLNLRGKDETIEQVLMKMMRILDLNYEFTDHALCVHVNGIKPKPLKPFEPISADDKEICKKLEKEVSFEFVDTPLGDALAFMKRLAGCSIVIDPSFEDSHPPVTLRVLNMPVASAFRWIARLTHAKCEIRDGAFFICTIGAYEEEPAASLTQEQIDEFKTALINLANDNFAVRETAMEKIAKLGVSARSPLLQALKAARDPEAVMRIDNLLEALPVGSPFEEEPEVSKFLAGEKYSRRISFELVDTPIPESLRFMSQLLREEILCDPACESRVQLEVSDMQASNALRWIARQARMNLAVKDGKLHCVKRRGR